MNTEEIIEQRKKKSEKELAARRAEQEKMLSDRKEGVAYIHNNKVSILIKELNDHSELTLVCEKDTNQKDHGNRNTVNFAYALCSSKDQFSLKIAKGIAGKRLKEKDATFSFSLDINKTIKNEKEILSFGLLALMFTSLDGYRMIPDRMYRAFKAEIIDEGWNMNYILAGD